MSEVLNNVKSDRSSVVTDEKTALRRSEERYRALIEATSQAVWSWSTNGIESDFERSREWWCELTGQSIEVQNSNGDAWLEMVHPDDRATAAANWTSALQTGKTYDSQFRVQSRRGGWRHIRVRGVPVRETDGTVREWIGTLEDVSGQYEIKIERERLLAEAENERRRLEEVFQHAPSFIAVLRGPQHVFERVNDRYVELIGGRQVVGLPVRQALPEIEGQGYFELLDRVYRSGQPHVAVDATVNLRNPSAATQRILQFVYQPMLDLEGNVTGVIVQGVDLTEQRRAEAGLARLTAEAEWQRRLYETALSNTADCIFLFDTQARFTYVNKALLDLWGKNLSQVIGNSFVDLDYPRELAERLIRQIHEVVQTGLTLRDEASFTTRNQFEGAFEYIFVPVFGIDGQVEAVAGSTRDITERKRMEQALRESEQRHRALVTATSDVVYRMSADWSIMQPLDGRDLVASNIESISNWMTKNIPDFEHSRIQLAIAEAVAKVQTFEMEHQVIRADGSLGWAFSRAVPIPDADGNIAEWFGTASDVTRRKQVEEELRDIRSRMEAALSAGAIGTWSWDIASNRFFGDSSLAGMFSVTPADLAGGPMTRIIESIHPDDRDRVQELINQAITSGERYEADYRVVQPGTGWKWVTARGQVQRNQTGRPSRFSGVVIDVTDWKRAKEELARVTEESNRRKRLYETILSNTPDLAYVFDLKHRFVYANETLLRLWGRTYDEAIGKTCLELGYEPWHAALHGREIEHVKLTRQPLRGEVPFSGTFGPRIYDYIFVPVLGTNGEVEAVAGTTRDVTERKASEESLKDADRKKDDFIALLAHELRNPLAPIRNGLQVMRLAEGDPVTVARAREMMERQLTHMVRLIDDLLDVSRITRNKMELRLAKINLTDVINSAVEAAGPAIYESDHELSVVVPSESVILEADLTRLAQVLSNLLTNSAKYTPRAGRIWLSATLAGSDVLITVRDTGIGIPSHCLPKIFDMFSQVDRSVERSAGGLGIGLALVKGLVEMHGGTVSADSIEGQGSTFTIRLPISTSIPISGPSTVDSHDTNSALRRVLVVDDNRDGADSMAMMLKLMGNSVSTAHDGLDAVSVAEAFRPEVILMDIGLPRLNGLDATRQIRDQPWGRDITIIALTGWGQDNDRVQSRAAGCDGHLVKPVNLTDLEKMLEEVSKSSM